MIDIETLSTKQNACVMTIGAIKFNRNDNELKSLDDYKKNSQTFYVRISRDSCDMLGLDVDDDTVSWWKKQTKNAQYEIFHHKDRTPIETALKQLRDFLVGTNYIWSQGSFDSVILEEVYKRCGIEKPWKFWNVRDTRTLFDIANVNLKSIAIENGDSHNALDDCYKQLVGFNISMKNIKV